MLDPETLERLARCPEQNAPALNLALAEEGALSVLLALAASPALDAEALAVVGERAARGDLGPALDHLLIAHRRAPGPVRDAVLARRGDDAGFVLAAASHPEATAEALERAVSAPALSAAHDRPWIAALGASAGTLRRWAGDPSPLRREAAARLAADPALLAALARDPARRVRRALAGNPHADRAALALDPAPDVRARAARGEPAIDPAEALAALRAGGDLAPDVARALASDELDEEGAHLAGWVLPDAELPGLVARLAPDRARAVAFAAGLGLRPNDGEARWVREVSRALARAPGAPPTPAGKARLAAWIAEGLGRWRGERAAVGRGALALDRTVLARCPALAETLVEGAGDLPAVAVERRWADAAVPEARVSALLGRVTTAPGDELDLDPSVRPLPVLERAVLAVAGRATVSARAALAVAALDERRVRYVLGAMPGFPPRLTGAALTRVLRHHAAALSAAVPEARGRAARVESWTARRLTEVELAVALGVGHLSGAEVARRLASGHQAVEDGASLSAAVWARAALEGPAAVAPVLAWAESSLRRRAGALALWLLVGGLDRGRVPALTAGALDGLEDAREAAPEAVCVALAALERQRPGWLSELPVGTALGRRLVASAWARAYAPLGA